MDNLWIIYGYGWWYTYPSEKYESIGMMIPNICKNNPNVPNHQPDQSRIADDFLASLVLFDDVESVHLPHIFKPKPYVENSCFLHAQGLKSTIPLWPKSQTGPAAKHRRTSPADVPNSSGFERGSRSLESGVELLVPGFGLCKIPHG